MLTKSMPEFYFEKIKYSRCEKLILALDCLQYAI